MFRHKAPLIGLVIAALGAATAVAQTPPRQDGSRRGTSSVTLRVLNQRLPDVEFVEQPFEQVMEWLGELLNINVIVRWQRLEDAGVERDAPVSIKARNLRFAQVLWLIMNEVGGSEVKLAYRAQGKTLVLSTADDLGQEMVTKVYDVSDLLITIPRASRAAAFDVTQGLGEGGTGGGGGGGGQGMFGQSQGMEDRNQEGDDVGAEETMDTLIDLIQQTVEPDSWDVNGGRGRIFPFRRLLVVYNTILVHQRLGGYVTDETVEGP